MNIAEQLKTVAANAIYQLYQLKIDAKDILINATKPEFTGDYTIVLFSFIKQLKKSPEAIGNEIGNFLMKENNSFISKFNVIKGFLNLSLADNYWIDFLKTNSLNKNFGEANAGGEKIMVEYSSPNTNKPLHLGHLRNNFLGSSISEILKANGCNVVMTCIVNDRGIHICKSMIAWQRFANGATPASAGIKGDHFVGDYYVKFNDEYKKQTEKIIYSNDFSTFPESERKEIALILNNIQSLETLLANTINEFDFNKIENLEFRIKITIESAIDGNIKWKNVHKIYDSEEFSDLTSEEKEQKQKWLRNKLKPIISVEEKMEAEEKKLKDIVGNRTDIMQAAQQMLLDWEAGKPDVIELWKKMNSWVYKGFEETYKLIGTKFDKTYYESNTYLLGKDLVDEGLRKKVFYQKEDGSVWIDLTADGLDEKLVRRKDGTSVYITQDIGLAELKQKEFGADQSIYVVGDEQNYHFKVLKLICQKLGLPSADGIYHLSYGMVELPTGKMKSREGTVVDADDIVAEMMNIARQKTEELGKVKDFSEEELLKLYRTLGLGALKFFLLRVHPKKKMVFNPQESIDFHGFTGPFVQYTYARIQSILRKLSDENLLRQSIPFTALLPQEKEILAQLEQFPAAIRDAAAEQDPSKIALYVYGLAKIFNQFYADLSIANAENKEKKILRLHLAQLTGTVIGKGMRLLGIDVPERM